MMSLHHQIQRRHDVSCNSSRKPADGGGVGNPRGLTPASSGPGSARGRDSLRRPPARGRHSLPGVGPTHFGFEKLWLRDDTYILRSVSGVEYMERLPCDGQLLEMPARRRSVAPPLATSAADSGVILDLGAHSVGVPRRPTQRLTIAREALQALYSC